MISDRLQSQIDSLAAVPDRVLSALDGYRQTVEPPTSLVLDPANANLHTPENLDAIGQSLNAFGFRKNAIAVQEGTRIVYAGNGIVRWCVENDVAVCPVLWIPESMTEAEAKAFGLADNQAARLAEYDFAQMQETLAALEGEFSPEDLGFDPDELDEAFAEIAMVDDAVSDMRKQPKDKDTADTGSGLVKLLFLPSEMSVVEKALRVAQKPSRGEALVHICKVFLGYTDAEK